VGTTLDRLCEVSRTRRRSHCGVSLRPQMAVRRWQHSNGHIHVFTMKSNRTVRHVETGRIHRVLDAAPARAPVNTKRSNRPQLDTRVGSSVSIAHQQGPVLDRRAGVHMRTLLITHAVCPNSAGLRGGSLLAAGSACRRYVATPSLSICYKPTMLSGGRAHRA
jgi:hypothetical protein